jgi:hypothetical protein
MTDDRNSIQVDLADPSSIKEALPRVQKKKADQAEVVREAQATLDYWASLEAIMVGRLGGSPSASSASEGVEPTKTPAPSWAQRSAQGDGMLDLVVKVVNDAGEPIRSRDVTATLVHHGQPVSSDSVSNALHYAATRPEPLLQRIRRGWYAPLRWEGLPHSMPADEDGGEPE